NLRRTQSVEVRVDNRRVCSGVTAKDISNARLQPASEDSDGLQEAREDALMGFHKLVDLFRKSRGANSNANAKDTGHIIAGVVGGAMNSLGGGKRKNCGAREYVSNKELEC
ncbi:hypothetical protein THAOC_24192, partial [Thalassiosira oceanica]